VSGGIEVQSANLLTQAILTGAQKHVNRNEALTRAGIAVTSNKTDIKTLASMAAIGGNIGKAQLGLNAASKEELMKDKQAKDKIAL